MISGYVRAAVHLICLKYILFLSLLSRLECAHQIQKISSIAQHPDSRRIDSVCCSKWTQSYYSYWSSIFIRSNLFQHFGAAVISRLRKKLLETKILNDDHSGRSMRLVGKQYCRHRQALWHPEQVSGEHQQASLSLCLTSQSLMQTLCQQNPSCSWFTHFDSQCYLLRECGNTEL